jgi:hypothetical protein
MAFLHIWLHHRQRGNRGCQTFWQAFHVGWLYAFEERWAPRWRPAATTWKNSRHSVLQLGLPCINNDRASVWRCDWRSSSPIPGALKEHNVPMPQFHLVLNMMVSWFPAICFYPKPVNSNQMTCTAKWSQPATYRIPRKYIGSSLSYNAAWDEQNLAIVKIARKYDFVKSVMDTFFYWTHFPR